jgi:N-dimethylarginine dimethylaminohydrolase
MATYQSETGKMKTLILKHVRDAFANDAHIAGQWQALHFHQPPDFSKAVAEYERFAGLFNRYGVDIKFLPAQNTTTLDSIYVRDVSIASDNGMILCKMGKTARRSEPGEQEKLFREMDTPSWAG